jgi:hypothetical protein
LEVYAAMQYDVIGGGITLKAEEREVLVEG